MKRSRQAIASMVVLSLCSLARAGTPQPGYADTRVATGLDAPTAIAFLPDGRVLITEKGGALKLQGTGAPVTLATIPVCTDAEMGLLGIAVDPAFASNGFIYLYRTQSSGDCASSSGRSNEVIRLTMAPDDTVSLASLTVLLTGFRTDNGNHDGGVLRVGPDGKLYVGVGDTGNGDNQGCPGSSTNPYAQDLNAFEGKVLRLNLDGTTPTDNPYFGQAGKLGQIFASGFRNPWRMGFDPVNGNLWVADVGDLAFEEVDIVTSGGNYEWPYCEGLDHPSGCAQPGDTAPIFEYGHGGGCPGDVGTSLGESIIGGSFAGAALSPFENEYFFADYTGSAVYRLTPNAARTGITGPAVSVSTNVGNPVDVITGPDGAIYYVAIGFGEVHRLSYAVPAPEQLITGKRMKLGSGADPNRKRLSAKSTDTSIDIGLGNLTADDPVLNGGSVRVLTADGCGGPCDTTYPLATAPPNDSWNYFGGSGANRGYGFRSKVGPIRSVTIRPRRHVNITGRGAGLGHDLAAAPNPVDVVLTVGGHRYCMEFGGTTRFSVGDSFAAKDAAAPVSCPP